METHSEQQEPESQGSEPLFGTPTSASGELDMVPASAHRRTLEGEAGSL